MNSICIDVECDFCNQYITGDVNFWASNWGDRFGHTTDVVFESENIAIVAGLGALSEGYVLLIPKHHFLSVAQLPHVVIDELVSLKLQVKDFLQVKFMSTVFFEHGAISKSKRAGACVDHVHLHALPSKFDFRYDLKKNFPERLIGSLQDLTKVSNPYIFYEDQQGTLFVYETPSQIPSQYVRRLWANSLAKPNEWDWAMFINEENVAKTIDLFADSFITSDC